MSNQLGISFRNKVGSPQILDGRGLPVNFDSGTSKGGAIWRFEVCTGDAPRTDDLGNAIQVPDIPYNLAAPQVLYPAPKFGMRPYLTHVTVDMQGYLPWQGGTAVVIEDTNGTPLVYLPTNSLRGVASYSFPDSDLAMPMLLAVASYNAATGVITFSNATGAFSNLVASSTVLDNYPAYVIAGTGTGQTFLISTYTGGNGSTITPVGGVSALAIPLDATSVVALPYWQATGGSTTTAAFSNAQFSTFPGPSTNALDNGYSLIGIVTANAGNGVRQIISNTNTTPAVATGSPFAGAVAAGDIFQINTNNEVFGATDLCVGDKWASAQINTGIQVNTIGSFTQGSNLRVYIEGFYAF